MTRKEFFQVVAKVAADNAAATHDAEVDEEDFDDVMQELRYEVACRLDIGAEEGEDDAYRDLHAWDGGT